jgi:hypothetical protein
VPPYQSVVNIKQFSCERGHAAWNSLRSAALIGRRRIFRGGITINTAQDFFAGGTTVRSISFPMMLLNTKHQFLSHFERGVQMKKFLLATTACVGLSAGTALANPLHGFGSHGANEQTIGGNAVTPTSTVTNFGLTASSAPLAGEEQLKFLIPNDFTLTQVQNFAAQVTVTAGANASLSLFSTTPWTSGNLEINYLGNSLANGAPKNPLDAFIGATNTLQPTATGYYVLLADVGQQTLTGPNNPPAQLFSLAPAVYAAGGLILGNLIQGTCNTNGGGCTDVNSTAQSGALFFNGASSGPFSAPSGAPGPVVGAGLPGVLAMLIGGLMWWRRELTFSLMP